MISTSALRSTPAWGIEEPMALAPGTVAPPFSLPSTDGRQLTLASLRGKKVVLYFYPKDDTPGCTVEACDFRDNLARVQAAGALLYGVSKDSLGSHERFRAKYQLPFPLLSDEDNAVTTAYGAYGKKLMYGRPVTGTIRTTYLIDEAGKISHVWSPVKVPGHVEQVVAALVGGPVALAAAASPVAEAAGKGASPTPAAKAAKASQKPAAAVKKAAPAPKPAAKQPAAKKPVAKRAAAKKPVAKKAAAKASPPKKTPAKRPAAKKPAAKAVPKPAARRAGKR